jgi:acetyltransferase-like isoleucine patch superfamily enzyme
MIGRGVRIGVNVSIMPGIKIGSGSFVGAGVVLGEDLPDGKYCRITPTVQISDNTKQPGTSRDEFKKKL